MTSQGFVESISEPSTLDKSLPPPSRVEAANDGVVYRFPAPCHRTLQDPSTNPILSPVGAQAFPRNKPRIRFSPYLRGAYPVPGDAHKLRIPVDVTIGVADGEGREQKFLIKKQLITDTAFVKTHLPENEPVSCGGRPNVAPNGDCGGKRTASNIAPSFPPNNSPLRSSVEGAKMLQDPASSKVLASSHQYPLEEPLDGEDEDALDVFSPPQKDRPSGQERSTPKDPPQYTAPKSALANTPVSDANRTAAPVTPEPSKSAVPVPAPRISPPKDSIQVPTPTFVFESVLYPPTGTTTAVGVASGGSIWPVIGGGVFIAGIIFCGTAFYILIRKRKNGDMNGEGLAHIPGLVRCDHGVHQCDCRYCSLCALREPCACPCHTYFGSSLCVDASASRATHLASFRPAIPQSSPSSDRGPIREVVFRLTPM